MKKSSFIIALLGLIMTSLWISCANKTKGNEAVADSTAIKTDTIAKDLDKHSEAYIRQRIDTIYSYVDQCLVNIDSLFCSQRYYALLQQASQLSEETGFVCLDYDHWIMGQDRSPEWTYDARKIENITDSTAEVEMDIRNFGKHNYVTLELKSTSSEPACTSITSDANVISGTVLSITSTVTGYSLLTVSP